jgi:hypothetical protein
MTRNKITDVVTKVVEILTPLSSDERRRVIGASLTLLGDEEAVQFKSGGKSESQENNDGFTGVHSRANVWIKQNSISSSELEQVFHIKGGVISIIAPDVPGRSSKEKTLNAYVLTGLGKLLAEGITEFDDKTAKELCKTLGCLDATNHAKYLNGKGNEFTGSKEKGWTLTAPGLKRGAVLVKELGKVSK